MRMKLILTLTAFAVSAMPAMAQRTCTPDFNYTGAIGHEKGASSRAALGKVFKAAKSRNFKEFMAVAADPYVQHSPDLQDGWKPVWDLMDKRPKGFSSALMPWLGPQGYLDNGNYLVMLREVNRGDGTPKSKIFDLMYFDQDGLYAEHWDMRQALSDKIASGRSETAQAKEFADKPVAYSVETEEANKRLVASFLNLAFNGSQLETALNLYVSPTYAQHNPLIPDGTQPVIDAFKSRKIPTLCYDIKFVLAQNDLVFVYSKVTSKGDVSAVVDLIRVRDNKMVEHWDVVQAVPADKDMPHKNGMF